MDSQLCNRAFSNRRDHTSPKFLICSRIKSHSKDLIVVLDNLKCVTVILFCVRVNGNLLVSTYSSHSMALSEFLIRHTIVHLFNFIPNLHYISSFLNIFKCFVLILVYFLFTLKDVIERDNYELVERNFGKFVSS